MRHLPCRTIAARYSSGDSAGWGLTTQNAPIACTCRTSAGNAEPILTLPTPDQEAKVKELAAAIKTREKALDEKIVGPVQAEWEQTRVDSLPPEPRGGRLVPRLEHGERPVEPGGSREGVGDAA